MRWTELRPLHDEAYALAHFIERGFYFFLTYGGYLLFFHECQFPRILPALLWWWRTLVMNYAYMDGWKKRGRTSAF